MSKEEKRRRLDALSTKVARLTSMVNGEERKCAQARSEVSNTERELSRVRSTLSNSQDPRVRSNIEAEIGRLEGRLNVHLRHLSEYESMYQAMARDLSDADAEYSSLRSSLCDW